MPAVNHPSVLAITSEIPWPLDSGGHLRTYHLLRMLATRFRVRVIVPAGGKQFVAGCEALRAAGIDQVIAVPLPTPNRVRSVGRIVRSVAKRTPYVMFARHHHRAVRRAFIEQLALARPDVIYFDHLDSFSYDGDRAMVPAVVDMHNVYSRLAARAAEEQDGAARRLYLRHEAALIARMERRAATAAHSILAVSEDEARYFEALGAPRVAVVPNGVDSGQYESLPLANRAGPPTIMYVGSFTWEPNVAAARFLATEVLPRVARHVRDVRVLFVGRDPGPDMRALADADARVTVAGNVPDLTAYLRQAHVLAVPLQVGGGTRLKILEAFAAGVPVVSTPIGCEGIRGLDGEHLVITERDGFADAITRLLADPAHACRLASAARFLAREHYDWEIVGREAAAAVGAATRAIRPNVTSSAQLAARTSMSR